MQKVDWRTVKWQYVNYYCDNEYERLKKISNGILRKFWSVPQSDYDDFYSMAATILLDCELRFNEGRGVPFESFLTGCLKRKFMTEMTARGRDKRCLTEKEKNGKTKKDEKGNPIIIQNLSLSMPINENGMELGDSIASDYCLEKQVDEDNEEYSDAMLKYLSKLSDLQKNVLHLMAINYSSSEIMEELHITNREYIDCKAAIRSCQNVCVLL